MSETTPEEVVHPQKRRGLQDLPDEMLENIADRLDSLSLAALSMTSDCLRLRLARYCTKLKIESVSQFILDYATYNSSNIQILDLNNCRARPYIVEDLIGRCKYVRELKVVNCGITLTQLLDALKLLNFVESLSFSFFDIPEGDGSYFKTYPSIKKVYMETPPLIKAYSPILDFLNSCVSVEFIQITFIGREQSRHNYRSRTSCLNKELWTTLHTVVFSCHQSSCEIRHNLADGLVDFCSASDDNRFWVRENMQFYEFEPGDEIESPAITEMIACKDISALEEAYGVALKPRSEMLRVLPFRLDERLPPHIVELDLTGCHGPFPKESWDNLVENVPMLEALAVPVCFLPDARDIYANADLLTLTFEDRLRARLRVANCCVVKALKRVKLKKLYLTGLPPSSATMTSCAQCRISWTSYAIGELEELPFLEELTLARINAPLLIFANLVNSRIKTARLSFAKFGDVRDLKIFMERCTSLEYLKIGALDLPLEKASFWEALAAGSKLKQFCLSPELPVNSNLIRVDVVREYLPRILSSLEIFHLHISTIMESFSKMIQELIAIENSMRESNKIYYLQPPCPTLSSVEFVSLIQAVPGRALCCSTNFIGKIPTDGWTND